MDAGLRLRLRPRMGGDKLWLLLAFPFVAVPRDFRVTGGDLISSFISGRSVLKVELGMV